MGPPLRGEARFSSASKAHRRRGSAAAARGRRGRPPGRGNLKEQGRAAPPLGPGFSTLRESGKAADASSPTSRPQPVLLSSTRVAIASCSQCLALHHAPPAAAPDSSIHPRKKPSTQTLPCVTAPLLPSLSLPMPLLLHRVLQVLRQKPLLCPIHSLARRLRSSPAWPARGRRWRRSMSAPSVCRHSISRAHELFDRMPR